MKQLMRRKTKQKNCIHTGVLKTRKTRKSLIKTEETLNAASKMEYKLHCGTVSNGNVLYQFMV